MKSIKNIYWLIKYNYLVEAFFKLRNSILGKPFAFIYGYYIYQKYKDNYLYWFNQFFLNEFLFKEPPHSSKYFTYKKFLFGLFMWAIPKSLLRKIYNRFGTKMLENIDLYASANQIDMLFTYLWFFTIFLSSKQILSLLKEIDYLLSLNNSSWKRDRFKAYLKYLYSISDNLFDVRVKQQVEAIVLIYLM